MPTFGEELRRERELREISLREIAEATRINLRYLEALEQNDFEHLPGGVFNRGFVRAYCQFIGVDAESMVNAYLLQERSQAEPDSGSDRTLWRGSPARAEMRPADEPPPLAPSRRRRKGWIVFLAAVALVSALVLIYLWYARAHPGALPFAHGASAARPVARLLVEGGGEGSS